MENLCTNYNNIYKIYNNNNNNHNFLIYFVALDPLLYIKVID
jgi:hypothetical protein